MEDEFIDDAPAGTVNAGDPDHVKVLADMESERQQLLVADIRTMLTLPEGRRVIWWMIEHANIFDSVFSINPVQMAHNEGKREAGVLLIRRLEGIGVNVFPQLLADAANDRAMDKAIQLQRIKEAKALGK